MRGAALAIFTLLVLFLMFGQNLLLIVIHGPGKVMGHGTERVRELIPVGMLLYCIVTIGTSMGERAIYFTASELDFLFPGPFSRRELLLYKIVGNVSSAAFVAVILATSFIMTLHSWPAAVLGSWLGVLQLNSLMLCLNLFGQIVSERAFTRARKLVVLAVVTLAALAAAEAASRGLQGPWQETLRKVRYSPAARVLLAPFEIHARIITAERIGPEVLGWAALGAGLVIACYALAIRLDANYLETAQQVSRKIQERVRAVSREGVFANHSKRPVRTTRLPQPPWLGGVGPLAWRQMLQMLRGGRGGLILIAVLLMVMVGPAIGFGQHQDVVTILPRLILAALGYGTLLVSAQLPWGFRGDYERIDLLKTLPIRPIFIALGQTLVVVAILTLVQWLILAATVVAFPASADEMLAAALFALPFNAILVGLEDLLFLLFPAPMVTTGSEGVLKMGRLMLSMLAKFFILGACAALAAALGGIAYLLTGSRVAAALVAWCVGLALSAAILVLISWAFQRFDVSDGAAE